MDSLIWKIAIPAAFVVLVAMPIIAVYSKFKHDKWRRDRFGD